MRRRGTPVSREALYEEVWTDAVTVVAPRYGLSDVGLVKICKKLGIPVPPRGYWAKVKAELRRSGALPWLQPDVKSQVSFRYEDGRWRSRWWCSPPSTRKTSTPTLSARR